MNYLHWNEKTITDLGDASVASMFNEGYVFTRIGKGVMQQTRSVRIDLSKYSASSENRRILKKTSGLSMTPVKLPLAEYSFTVGKLAKDFYDAKFGPGIMSAQKVKEMLTDAGKSNFNTLLTYSDASGVIGYTIAFESPGLMHYSYPFYNLEQAPKDAGMGMMVRAIEYAKQNGMKYIYLGSLQRPGDSYKLQFEGLEWFDGKEWKTDLEEAKNILSENKKADA
jgi:arginyl-tRNA--protein-N-Asp/Glu arginylyltransferase